MRVKGKNGKERKGKGGKDMKEKDEESNRAGKICG